MRLFRIIYIFLSWIIIWRTTPLEGGVNAFIVSVFIFTLGMLYDYIEVFNTATKLNNKNYGSIIHKIVGAIGIGLSTVYVLSCVLLWMDVLNIDNNTCIYLTGNDLRESSKVISVNMYQKVLAIYIFLSCIEIYSPTKRRLGAKLVIAELAETKDN